LRKKAISRNQSRAGLRPACAWFKNEKFILQQQVHKLQFPVEYKDVSDFLNSGNHEKGSLKVDEIGPNAVAKLNALSSCIGIHPVGDLIVCFTSRCTCLNCVY